MFSFVVTKNQGYYLFYLYEINNTNNVLTKNEYKHVFSDKFIYIFIL